MSVRTGSRIRFSQIDPTVSPWHMFGNNLNNEKSLPALSFLKTFRMKRLVSRTCAHDPHKRKRYISGVSFSARDRAFTHPHLAMQGSSCSGKLFPVVCPRKLFFSFSFFLFLFFFFFLSEYARRHVHLCRVMYMYLFGSFGRNLGLTAREIVDRITGSQDYSGTSRSVRSEGRQCQRGREVLNC